MIICLPHLEITACDFFTLPTGQIHRFLVR
jgi:hypothetical protein